MILSIIIAYKLHIVMNFLMKIEFKLMQNQLIHPKFRKEQDLDLIEVIIFGIYIYD